MKKSFLISLSALLLLCSCGKSDKEKTYVFDSTKEATYTVANEYPVTARQVQTGVQWRSMTPAGNPQLLVIPVDFPDYKCNILPKGCEGTRNDIQAAYFGTEADTVLAGSTDTDGWESVKSYYYESSYGKMEIGGVVTPWFTYSSNVDGMTGAGASRGVLIEAVDWYKQYCIDNGLPFDFDDDNDGFIDNVQLIYAPDARHNGLDDLWWAYTSSLVGNMANFESPNPYNYVFASQSFMYHDTNYIDAHTYIHEMGHVLGLWDYYNTSDNPTYQKVKAAGGVDMMDQNVGDHNSYSKFALQWVAPKVVTGEGSITIKPFTTSGDAIIVSPGWNGTAFDEYLIIEYHRPIGLNKQDSERRYTGSYYPFVMSDNGIKVYHIDSRMAYVDALSRSFIEYTTTFKQDARNTTIIAHSNTPSNQEDDYRLIHLLEATGKNSFFEGKTATNETLFKQGATFGAQKGFFKGFKFHSGLDLPFVFEITSITDEEAVITFAKK